MKKISLINTLKKTFNKKKILKKRPIWQYIIFKYNEQHIEKAKAMASKHDLTFLLVQSSRWQGDEDYLKPKEYALNAF